MKYPSFLKSGDTLGVTAPSFGIHPDDIERYEKAKQTFRSLGIEVIETPNVHTIGVCASGPAQERAKQFCDLYARKDVKCVVAASGGQLELLIADKLDFYRLDKAEPKWFCGYSDNTVISYLLATRLDTASVYGYGICGLGDDLHISSTDHIDLITGRKTIFQSYPSHASKHSFTDNERNNYDALTEWRNLQGNGSISGRLIGGCLDILGGICGTTADRTASFIKKYGDEGIVWFLESCDLDPSGVARVLWQLKNAGWFNKAVGFVFGRPYISEEMFGLSFEAAVLEILGDTRLPIITGADIGHVPPILPILCGSYANIQTDGRKATIEYKLIP